MKRSSLHYISPSRKNAIETIKTLTYGTELEYTHVSRERAAKAIHSVVGGTVSHLGGAYDEWTVTAPDGRNWKAVSDGSLGSHNENGGKMMLYFAYGSNLNPKRMAERAPHATVAGIGILHNWRLAERLYADVEPADGECVFGVLYQMPPDDLIRLDRHEGCPKIYARETVLVESAGRDVLAQIYVMTDEAKLERDGVRFPLDYRKICSAGADFHRIPNAFRRRLKPAIGNTLVAVYGTLMTGERNYRWGAGAVRRTPCRLYGTLYDTGYGFPAFVPNLGETVSAELLEVPPDVLAQMNQLEGYPHLYRQELVLAETPAGVANALVYVMNHLPESAKIIPSGNWRQHRKESSKY